MKEAQGVRMEPERGEASPERVRSALAAILASDAFDASERNRRFLAYVVEETLAGRADRIKAYSIATTVFGRGEGFDPQLDSIVRIEAGRLRRSLERYHLTEGREAGLRIEIPKGSYVPAFSVSRPAPVVAPEPTAAARARPQRRPSIVVAQFDEDGDSEVFPHFARGFTRTVVAALTRFTDLTVFGPDGAPGHASEPDPHRLRAEHGVDFVLTGGAALAPDRFTLDALLIDSETGRTVWAESFERRLEPSEIVALRNDVANRVAGAIAQPYGAIFTAKAREIEGAPPASLQPYACVLRFHQYCRTYDRGMMDSVHRCLERAVAAEPDYGEAHACLSLLFTNAQRFNHQLDGCKSDPIERALIHARRALALEPNASLSHYAFAMALWFGGDVAGALESLETGLALNPNDTRIMADLGQRYALLMQWDRAVPLLKRSFERNPAQPSPHRIGLFLWRYANGRIDEALAEARKIDTPDIVYGHLTVAMAASALGRLEETRAALDRLAAIDPRYAEHARADLARRNLHPDLIELVLAGLDRARGVCAAA